VVPDRDDGQALLGIDLGTSGVKAILLGGDGRLLPPVVGSGALAGTLRPEAAGLAPPAVPLGAGEPVGPSARSAAYDDAFDRYAWHADAGCRTITSSTLGAQ
jgi:hypothetical protein